ncbi:MAG: phosphodiester glycosidase family protein [Haliscomenobacter sp.]|uniref:phosphodiester glycosidase family protein n=1 Tax=Haliscomenobacter sp. TaxID=2717303 RepID=UPI0029BA9B29|nr:phosphodiester glycosidase family protein [Haliscomenobacter sp.]MDX2071372.1 phosphodiester glycosidase family protein [Haliscomenobacter sp.]
MMIRLLILFIALPQIIFAQVDSVQLLLKKTDWHVQKIAPKAKWEQHHFAKGELFHANQNVNILRIKRGHRPLNFAFASGGKALIPTSIQGQQAKALAALNGTFFDVKNGGSVDLIRINGMTLDTTRPSGQFLAEHQRSAIVIKNNQVQIVKGDSIRGWEKRLLTEDNVMVTGPLLIHEGKKIHLPARSFNTTRHPRTALGITRRGEILWITVDGRVKEAAGMSLYELSHLMEALGCVEAINLDGGGSTTLWIDGATKTGVVNMPCDDKVFDEYGERKVSNVLLLSRRKPEVND